MTGISKIALIAVGALVIILLGGFLLVSRADIPASVVDPLYSNEASQILTLPSGQRVHLRDQGRPKGAALVLIHGSAASLHSWEPWVERLGDTYRIITIDLPGHGLTGPHIREDYSKGAYVRFVDDVMRTLKLEQFVLGGFSMGGDISWRYALAYPQKVRGLILVDSGGYRVEDSDGPIIFSLLRFGIFRWLFQRIHSRALTEEGLRNAYNNSPVVTDRLVQRYVDLNLREGQRRATALRFAENNNNPVSPPPRNVLNMPTLILWGREDRLINVKYAEKFRRDLLNASLVVYDNVGHMPQEEIPGRSASDVRAFLEGMNWGKLAP